MTNLAGNIRSIFRLQFASDATVLNVRLSAALKTHSVLKTLEYDHVGRLTKVWHEVEGGPSVLLMQNTYNELGQLVDKKLHSTVPSTIDARQSVDYRYNIRGWLERVNDEDLTGGDNGDPYDYFSMQLGYDQDVGIGNQEQYNGNISAMKWSSNLGLSEEKMRGYVYAYDPMNRIKSAGYMQGTGSVGTLNWSVATGQAFSLSGLTYDLNRKGLHERS